MQPSCNKLENPSDQSYLTILYSLFFDVEMGHKVHKINCEIFGVF